MTKITLVRHGETDWNKSHLYQGRSDIPLNNTGIEQAKKTAYNFNTGDFDIIISSPLLRAKKTAEIIAEYIEYKDNICLNNNLIERNFGSAEGKFIKEYSSLVYNNLLDDMEKDEEIKKRTISTLKELAIAYPNKSILVVCHAHVIKSLLSFLEPENYNYSFMLANASVTSCLYNHIDETFKLDKVNFFKNI